MEILQSILDNSQYSFLSAFVLGLMTAFSPCPLATNISAVGYIGRDLSSRNKVFFNGLLYTLGRVISYTLVAMIIYLGAGTINLAGVFQGWGEKLIGPLMVIIGLLMLDVIKLNIPGVSQLSLKLGEKFGKGVIGPLLLGVIFALAFCPYSGVLYFAILIPMSVASPDGLYLPIPFAVATGLPVIIFSWFLAYAVNRVGKIYNKIKSFELWFRRGVAALFIITGLYLIIIYFVEF